MAERYTLTSLEDVAATFGLAPPAGSVPRFNIAPLQLGLIRTPRAIIAARWGLLPPWRGHGGKRGPHVVHAIADLIDDTPLLRNAFKSQRCLAIADGFFIWQATEKKSVPIWIHPPPAAAASATAPPRARAVAFAALAATHRDDGQPSFALLAGHARPPARAPAGATGPIDLALPFVIAPADHAAWLTGTRDDARALIARPVEVPAGWRAEPVSSYVNSLEHDDARCVESLRNPAQGELF